MIGVNDILKSMQYEQRVIEANGREHGVEAQGDEDDPMMVAGDVKVDVHSPPSPQKPSKLSGLAKGLGAAVLGASLLGGGAMLAKSLSDKPDPPPAVQPKQPPPPAKDNDQWNELRLGDPPRE